MRYKVTIFLALMLPVMLRSQNATATLENVISCAGDNAQVAINVTNFIDVGAMSIYIGYDTNHAAFLSIQNINPAIPGNILSNASNGVISIVYSYVTGFNIANGKLFDLNFQVLGDTTFLPFLTGTEIANSILEVIPLDTYPGSISNGLVIYDQPDNVQTYPDTDVSFAIDVKGSPSLQWQVNTGSGFVNLQNNATYSGVYNEILNVYNVQVSFNGNLYRCKVYNDVCTNYSDAALLEVSSAFTSVSLGNVLACPDDEVLVPLSVSDFADVIEFTFNISYNTNNLEFLGLENIYPGLLPGNLSATPITTNPPGISIHWVHSSPLNISGGKLFDLNFHYSAQYNILAFEDGTQALNTLSNPISLTLSNGSVGQYEIPIINQQPEDYTATAGENAYFSVVASGATEFQWMMSPDQGMTWDILSEGIPYYNTRTPMLTIDPVSHSMNGHYYACMVSNQFCPVTSDAAILSVDTLTFIQGNGFTHAPAVSPNPFRDHLWLHTGAMPGNVRIRIFDTRGNAVYEFDQTGHAGTSGVKLDMSSLSKGVYFMKIMGDAQGESINETKKIIKID